MIPLSLSLAFLSLLRVLPSRGAALVDFQVAQPPIVPHNAKQCTIQVLQSVHIPLLSYSLTLYA